MAEKTPSKESLKEGVTRGSQTLSLEKNFTESHQFLPTIKEEDRTSEKRVSVQNDLQRIRTSTNASTQSFHRSSIKLPSVGISKESITSPPPVPMPRMKVSTDKLAATLAKSKSDLDEAKFKAELARYSIDRAPLFATVLSDGNLAPSIQSTDNSFLITGFGLRNLSSLQNALQDEEQKRLEELYRAQREKEEEEEEGECSTTQSEMTQTDRSSFGRPTSLEREKLEYLMGLPPVDEEEHVSKVSLESMIYEESVEEPLTGMTEAMRQAQKYMRSHKIFEFFQFLIAHMLSTIPENPIDFLVQLLDKCLLYRAGFGEAPILYNKKHLQALFYLMDHMREGFIEVDQYKTGMVTLGICSYNQNPPTTLGMVTKEFFIEEAYDCLTNLLNDMIKRRWLRCPPPITPPPPPTPQASDDSGSSQGSIKFRQKLLI